MDEERASQELADQLRRIIGRLAVVRPQGDELRRAAEVAGAFADRLDQLPERGRTWEVSEAGLLPREFQAYSPLSGPRNPLAPPVRFHFPDQQTGERPIFGEVTFGAAYEGPPGHCHGGYVAAVFDELLGFAQFSPGFTAYLHVDYRRVTPLHRRLDLKAWVERVEGRKRYVRGECRDGSVLLSEAEGLFIAPRDDAEFLSRLDQQR
ncbi:MAG TPA: PaaI family thioesterase [Mycobacteriales bacterium]|nr:PaaI family thioesterase [Mycobacteriales bacterium]